MRTLSQLIEEAKQKLDIQDDTINYIPVEDLKKYLEVTNRFISSDAKEVVNYLIVNNDHYVKDLSDGNDVENALAYFYDNGPYSEDHKKELYALVGKIIKAGRMMEIPVFQTKDQFAGIIAGKISPDEVILDLTSEQGRNIIAKRYEGLVRKIALQFANVSEIPLDDLIGSGFEGLVYAMNGYGKKSKKAEKREEQTGEELNIDQYKKTTFLTFASFSIRNAILDTIKNDAHTVKIPANQQKDERDQTGGNMKHRSISGDKPVNDEEGGKTIFDLVGGFDSANKSINRKDINRSWKLLIKNLIDSGDLSNFIIYCFLYTNHMGDYIKVVDGSGKEVTSVNPSNIEKVKLVVRDEDTNDGSVKDYMSNKELSEIFKKSSSNITYCYYVVVSYIQKHPRLKSILREINDLYYESKQIKWSEEIEPVNLVYDNTKIDY